MHDSSSNYQSGLLTDYLTSKLCANGPHSCIKAFLHHAMAMEIVGISAVILALRSYSDAALQGPRSNHHIVAAAESCALLLKACRLISSVRGVRIRQ
jgi:hypothetical protein